MTDAQQFEVFMRNYQNMVFSTALRLTANRAEAEDIAQEVVLKAYERFSDLRDSPTAGGWLRTVATNMSLNHLSRYRSRWTFFSELVHGGGGPGGMGRGKGKSSSRRRSIGRTSSSVPTATNWWIRRSRNCRRRSECRWYCITWKDCAMRKSLPNSTSPWAR